MPGIKYLQENQSSLIEMISNADDPQLSVFTAGHRFLLLADMQIDSRSGDCFS